MKKSSREKRTVGWHRILVCQAICEKRCCCVLLRQLQLVLESSLETVFGALVNLTSSRLTTTIFRELPRFIATFTRYLQTIRDMFRATQDNPHPSLECSFCPLHSRIFAMHGLLKTLVGRVCENIKRCLILYHAKY